MEFKDDVRLTVPLACGELFALDICRPLSLACTVGEGCLYHHLRNSAFLIYSCSQHERFNPRNVNRDVVLTHCTLKLVKRNWTRISENREAQVGGVIRQECLLAWLFVEV